MMKHFMSYDFCRKTLRIWVRPNLILKASSSDEDCPNFIIKTSILFVVDV